MTSLTARIHPTSRAALSVLADVRAVLRQHEHGSASGDETPRELPGLGTLVVTELPRELVLNFVGAPSAEPANVREAIAQQIRHAAGSRSAAAKLVITWAESTPQHAARTT